MLPLVVFFLVLLLRSLTEGSSASSDYFVARQFKPSNPTGDVHDSNNAEAQQERVLDMIRETYPREYYNSTISHHFFLRMVPIELQKSIQNLIWKDEILRFVRSKLPKHTRIVPDVYHEIYFMRPEIDFIDSNKAHYDGILKMLPPTRLLTLRSLTYLQGNPATFVAMTSMVNYTTDVGSSIIIDFNRELHYAVINKNNTTTTPRIIIKAAVHVFGPETNSAVVILQIIAHRIIFFAIKSLRIAYESTEGSSTPLMILDNIMRTLNKIHMLLPILSISIPLVSILMLGPIRYPMQFTKSV